QCPRRAARARRTSIRRSSGRRAQAADCEVAHTALTRLDRSDQASALEPRRARARPETARREEVGQGRPSDARGRAPLTLLSGRPLCIQDVESGTALNDYGRLTAWLTST